MINRFSVKLTLLLIVTILGSSSLFAGTKGKISGKVVDEFGEPLIGVQVVIDGTTKGVLTDLDGNYTIVNLDPGTYTIVFNYIGFATTRVQEVKVIVDKTTEIDATLREEVIEGEEIVVVAERPIVEKDRTTTTAYISSEQLEELPVVSLNEVINQQAGVVDGHFRGGRTGEVSYLVNGVPINNAFNNSQAFEVEQNMVSSLEVISGVFNAEYGQALSGVVNIVTKGVSPEWTANINASSGTIVSNRQLEFVTRTGGPDNFLGVDDFGTEKVSYTEASEKFGDNDIQFSVGGPIIKDKFGIQTTLRYVANAGYLIGKDLYTPTDQQFGLASGDPGQWLIESSGSGDFEPLNYNNRYSLNTAFIYELTSRFKIDYNLFLQKNDGRSYDHNFKYNPDGINTYYNTSQNHILGLRYTVGQNSFFNFSYSYLRDSGGSYLYNKATDTVLSQDYVSQEQAEQQGADAFVMGGNYLGSGQQITQSHTVVTDFTSQLNNIVLFKAGLSTRIHSLDNESFGITVTPVGDVIRSTSIYDNNSLKVNPYEAAGYSQVKLEFENLIVNAGLRFDYFEPDFVVPVDISRGTQDYLFPDPVNAPNDSVSNRTQGESTFQVSPRLGIAFPISETGVMRFSAGLFFQTPQLGILYTNNEFEVSPTANSVTYGNASLKPERTLSFEVGLQQGITETLGLDLTLFSKDIRDLSGTEVFRNRDGRPTAQLVNLDYGTIKGGTLSLYQRGGGPVSWTIDYTLQFASGSASNPQETFNRFINGQDPIIKINRLDWDRRNVLNNSITWNSNFGVTISAINNLQTGRPYTSVRDFTTSTVPNNEDIRIQFNTDVKVYYKPPSIKRDIQLYLQVDNLFDAQPDYQIYTDTGLAKESTELERRIDDGGRPGGPNSYEEIYLGENRVGPPRTIRIGLSLRF